MSLVMKMFKDKVRFEWTDGEVESAVTLTAEDSEEGAVSKLKRVIALVEGEQAPALTGMAKAIADFGARAKADAATGGPRYVDAAPAQTGNGWAAVYGPPEVPERLQGEVELIPPGEDA